MSNICVLVVLFFDEWCVCEEMKCRLYVVFDELDLGLDKVIKLLEF